MVAESYPDLTFVVNKKSCVVTIEGAVTLRTPVSGVPTPIALRIKLPAGYPRDEPQAFETARRFDWGNLDGHVLRDGKLCLWLAPRSTWAGHDPAAGWDRRASDALLRFIDQVVIFCERYLTWEAGGKKTWPGGESAHAGFGYVEYIYEAVDLDLEKLKGFCQAFGEEDRLDPYTSCPCGSGKKYRFCHRARVHDLRRRCGGPILAEDFARWIERRRCCPPPQGTPDAKPAG